MPIDCRRHFLLQWTQIKEQRLFWKMINHRDERKMLLFSQWNPVKEWKMFNTKRSFSMLVVVDMISTFISNINPISKNHLTLINYTFTEPNLSLTYRQQLTPLLFRSDPEKIIYAIVDHFNETSIPLKEWTRNDLRVFENRISHALDISSLGENAERNRASALTKPSTHKKYFFFFWFWRKCLATIDFINKHVCSGLGPQSIKYWALGDVVLMSKWGLYLLCMI